MRSISGRPRYFLVITAGYFLAGLIIVARALLAGAIAMVVVGAVFLALAAVRTRDYRAWRARQP
jgi:hypothetical protein